MTLGRSLAVFFLAASLFGGATAQGRGGMDDETIFTAVEHALQGARSLATARITVQSRDGFVTLSGFAATVEDVAAAGRPPRACAA
jgi:osmotically-inducible protein OsmY